MLKKSKLVLSVSLLVQSFTLFVLFLILCAKKKSIAAAFLGVSAMEGAAGLYLFSQAQEELSNFDPSDYMDEDLFDDMELDLDEEDASCEDDDAAIRMEIPLDENVSEEEFKDS